MAISVMALALLVVVIVCVVLVARSFSVKDNRNGR